MTNPVAQPLSPAKVKALLDDGHIIVDARASATFGAGHIPGAYNVQISGSEFEQRVGWVTPDNAPLILVTDNAADAQTAITKMAFIALDSQVVGYLDGGVTAWMNAGYTLDTIAQIDVHTLHHRVSTNGLQVLDVREQDEWDEGHISGAHMMPYTSLAPQLDIPAQIDKLPLSHEQSVAITCATGQRSSTAASMLRRHGFQNLYNVTGGMAAWKAAKLPTLDGEGNLCKF